MMSEKKELIIDSDSDYIYSTNQLKYDVNLHEDINNHI